MEKTVPDELVFCCAFMPVSVLLSNSGSIKLLPGELDGFNMTLFISNYRNAVTKSCSIEPESRSAFSTESGIERNAKGDDACVPNLFTAFR